MFPTDAKLQVAAPMTATRPGHVPAVQELVAIPLDRIFAGAGYRGHNARPTKSFESIPPARSAASLHGVRHG